MKSKFGMFALSLTSAVALALTVEGLAGAQEPKSAESVQLKKYGDTAPKLLGETSEWLNTDGKKLEFTKGKVYMVHFWTFGCINCKHNLDAYNRLIKKYEKQGVVMIGVHSPETKEEFNFENVKKQVKALGITYPVLFDPKLDNWKRWGLEYWPTIWLVDKQGKVQGRWVGEFEFKAGGGEKWVETGVEKMLKEKS